MSNERPSRGRGYLGNDATRNAKSSWWCHQIKTFSALLALCVGNSPVTREFPSKRPVTRSFDVFVDRLLNKRLNKQSKRWWFEMALSSLVTTNQGSIFQRIWKLLMGSSPQSNNALCNVAKFGLVKVLISLATVFVGTRCYGIAENTKDTPRCLLFIMTSSQNVNWKCVQHWKVLI